METKFLIGIILLVLTLGAGGVYFAKSNGLLATGFTPVYCNDFEFTCCNEQKISTYDSVWKNDPGNIFTCDGTSDYCSVQYSGYVGFELCKTPTISSCIFNNGIPLIGARGYQCQGQIRLGQNFNGNINPRDAIYICPTVYANKQPTVHVETYKSRLDYCGRAGCTTGVPVSGADKCSFQTDKSIYGTAGQILKSPSSSSTSYSVPKTQCVLAYQSGDRHICGNKEEQCSTDSDCGGHTYGNKECSGRTLQTYGCKKYPDPNTAKDYDLGWTLGDTLDYTASRCEISSAVQVQCCGDTDCGSNAFCDRNTWTCQQNVQCRQNSDCGVSTVCDWTTKELRSPACSSGTCTYNKDPVECCSDVNCPQGYFCGADRKCKESSVPKQACPYGCCLQQVAYFDKPCVSGQTCCGDNTCKADCASVPPVVDDEWCKQQGGTVVETIKNCDFVQSLFGCKGETTKVCRIAHTQIAGIIVLIAGIGILIYGLVKENTSGLISGIILAVLSAIWLILAGKGIL